MASREGRAAGDGCPAGARVSVVDIPAGIIFAKLSRTGR
jgi:hypothetical protein